MKFAKTAGAVSLLLASAAFLSACGNTEGEKSASASKVASKPVVGADGMTEEGRKAAQELEDMNKPLRTDFTAPALADDKAYVDVLSKLSAIQIYTSKRAWEETDEEIAKSMSGSILVNSALPELHQYQDEFEKSEDAFRKRELTKKIAELVKVEAAKLDGNIRVKMLVDADLKSFDFASNSFVSSNCLFSEKLSYTAAEMSNPNAYANAEKPRCFLQPSTTNFRVGLINGSKLKLKLDDESLAKKIESQRQGTKFEVLGYVSNIERERVGGSLGDARYIMIDPQRIKLIGAGSGEVLYTQDL